MFVISKRSLTRTDSQDSSLLPIFCVVMAIHSLLLVWAVLANSTIKPMTPPPPRLIVQTINLPPPSMKVAKETPKSASLRPAVINQLEVTKEPIIEDVEEEKEVAEIIKNEPVKESKEKPLIKAPDEIAEEVISKPIPPPLKKPTPKPLIQPEKVAPKHLAKEKLNQPEIVKPQPKAIAKIVPAKKTPSPPKVLADKTKPKPTKALKKTETIEQPKKAPVKTPPPSTKDIDKAQIAKAKIEEDKIIAEKSKKKAADDLARKKAADETAKQRAAEAQANQQRQQALVAQVQKNLSNINQTRDKLSQVKANSAGGETSVKMLSALQVDAVSFDSGPKLSDREASYCEELRHRLQLKLRFPDYGEVKIKLTLDRSGTIHEIVVVSAKSAANRKYIEDNISKISFPSFGSQFGDVAKHTFSINLCNE